MCGVLWSGWGWGVVGLPLSLAEDQFSGASGLSRRRFLRRGILEHPQQRFGGSRTCGGLSQEEGRKTSCRRISRGQRLFGKWAVVVRAAGHEPE